MPDASIPGDERGVRNDARDRLAVLRRDAAAAYAAITAADDALRRLAARRAASERSLRAVQWLHADEQSLAAARQAVREVKDEFAATVAARAEAVAALRRLSAECAAAQAKLVP